MKPLSEKTKELLHQAGWSEQRRVDTSRWEAFFRKGGYPIFPKVMEFLSHYGGLTVKYPDVYGIPDRRTFYIDPIKADIGGIDELSQRAGKPLCPIGERNNNLLILLMDEDAQLYETADEGLARLENLENLDPIELIPNHLTNEIEIP